MQRQKMRRHTKTVHERKELQNVTMGMLGIVLPLGDAMRLRLEGEGADSSLGGQASRMLTPSNETIQLTS